MPKRAACADSSQLDGIRTKIGTSKPAIAIPCHFLCSGARFHNQKLVFPQFSPSPVP